MTMPVWLRLLVFGCALLDLGVSGEGKTKDIILSSAFVFLVECHRFEIDKKIREGLVTGSDEVAATCSRAL